MKKIISLSIIMLLQLSPAKAQWVTIPDTILVNKLTLLYPTCMIGNQMDTTCNYIVFEDSLTIEYLNLTSVEGVQYFDNLQFLACEWNQITSLPILPNFLNRLECSGNELINLPQLPSNLVTLYCGNNQLTSLPALPNSLKYIYYEDNQLTSLPTLPNSLSVLRGWNNPITSLPTLPNSLTALWVTSNLLSSLPPLPNTLNYLHCGSNPLTSFPNLPPNLYTLSCENLQLTSLPQLPPNVTTLLCSNNQLTNLPTLAGNINQLDCSNNQLTSLPQLPYSMYILRIDSNQISCLTNLPQIYNGNNTYYANITGNPLTCVPNQTNYSLGLPLCTDDDSVNNPLNCQAVANILGYVYKDINSNCTYNNNIDLKSENVPVKLYDNQNNFLGYSNTINGVYSFTGLQPDSFLVKINDNALLLAMACGQTNSQVLALDSANQTISNINFPVVCDTVYDIYVQSLNTNGFVFPGQIHLLNTDISNNLIWYNLNCASTNYSGTISLEVSGPVTYLSATNAALTPTVIGNTYTYNVSNFNSITPYDFGLQFLTDTTAQAGDQICVHVEINPTPIDADTTNNVYDFCYQVVNSYDPNMKEVYPVNVLPGYDDWFTYTIHFQNTGNAPAFNIRLKDTLDANLDINSFEVRGYSHPAQISINGNILTVRFNNIMLPDSTTDYEGSMGYFQYRLKPLPNLPNGTQIENTAYIYFDYNAPIITNTTQNNFVMPVKTNNPLQQASQLSLYPNPSNGIFTFNESKNIKSVEVFNMMGELILSQGNAKNINLQTYPKGIYMVRINGMQVIRLVKE